MATKLKCWNCGFEYDEINHPDEAAREAHLVCPNPACEAKMEKKRTKKKK